MKGLYVYGMIEERKIKREERLQGVDFASPPTFFSWKDLEVIVSDIDDSGLEHGSLAEKMRSDTEWLKTNIILHHEVVSMVCRDHTVVPLKFGTIFSDRKSLTEELEKNYRSVKTALKEIGQKEEWALKVYVNKEEFVEKVRRKKRTEKMASDWYRERKEEEQLKEKLSKRLDALLSEIVERFRKISVKMITQDLPSIGEPVDPLRTIVLYGALLVPRERSHILKKETEKLDKRYQKAGLRLEMVGPWPPYSFVE